MHIKGIICDLDGTLYDNKAFLDLFHECYIHFISNSLNISFEEASDLIAFMQNTIQKNETAKSELHILDELGLKIIDWLSYSNKHINPYSYINKDIELENILKKKGDCWVDVATNTSFYISKKILACLGIIQYIDNIWSPDTLSSSVSDMIFKPSPFVYKKVLSSHSVNGNEIALIGDRYLADMSYARGLGISLTYLVKNSSETKAILKSLLNVS